MGLLVGATASMLAGVMICSSVFAQEGKWALVRPVETNAVAIDKERITATEEALVAALAEGGAFRIVPKDVIEQRAKELLLILQEEHLKAPRGLLGVCQDAAAKESYTDIVIETTIAKGRKNGTCAIGARASGLLWPSQFTQVRIEGACSKAGLQQSAQSAAAKLKAWVTKRWQKKDDPPALDNDEILEKMKIHLEDFKSCNDKFPIKAPLAHGSALIEMTILQDGRVGMAKLMTDDYKGAPVIKCITNAIDKIRFRVFSGPVKTIRFPFNL